MADPKHSLKGRRRDHARERHAGERSRRAEPGGRKAPGQGLRQVLLETLQAIGLLLIAAASSALVAFAAAYAAQLVFHG